MAFTIIGVMGPGAGATTTDVTTAHRLGALIAAMGWAILTGGRNEGVMHAALQGTRSEGGITIGVLPGHCASSFSLQY